MGGRVWGGDFPPPLSGAVTAAGIAAGARTGARTGDSHGTRTGTRAGTRAGGLCGVSCGDSLGARTGNSHGEIAGGTRTGSRAGTRAGACAGTRSGTAVGARTFHVFGARSRSVGVRGGAPLPWRRHRRGSVASCFHCLLFAFHTFVRSSHVCPALIIRPSSLPPSPGTAPPSHAFEREPQLAARAPRPRVRPRHVPLPHPCCHWRPRRPSTSFGVIIDILLKSPVGKSTPRGTPEALPKFCFRGCGRSSHPGRPRTCECSNVRVPPLAGEPHAA